MNHYTLSEKDLKAILELAFTAGYESPIEFMNQEVESIIDSFNLEEYEPLPRYEVIKTKKNEGFLDTNSLIDEFRDYH